MTAPLTVTVIVQVPPDTPAWEPVFLAGDGPTLGNWAAPGLPLPRGDAGFYHATLPQPDRPTHFTVTRGRWRLAAGDGTGRAAPPRLLDGPNLTHTVATWGRDAIHYHHQFASAFLPHPRTITVWLPPDYDGQHRFPVFYLHDGQNLFDAATSFAGVPWAADEAAETTIRRGQAQSVILVGVANTPDRLREYGPRRCGLGRTEDLSRAYGRFLIEEVKAFVDRTYATWPGPTTTAVGGSSLGGLISLHLAKWYPAVFGRCAAISPSLWWDREYFLHNFHVNSGWLDTGRIWLDMGDREGLTQVTQDAGIRRSRRLARLLTKHARESVYHEIPGGEHNEWHWGQRFSDVLAYLFPAKSE